MQHATLIHHFLEASARRFPDKTALIHGDVRATYKEINTKADALARWLVDQGLSIGDRVALLLENGLEYVVGYYGVLKSGAVAVPLSTDLKPDGLTPLLAELEPFAIVSSKRFEKLFTFVVSELPSCRAARPSRHLSSQSSSFPTSEPWLIQNSKFIMKNYGGSFDGHALRVTEFDDIVASGNRPPPCPEMHEDSLAAIIYTSGSTGTPKGVMLSHDNIVSNTKVVCEYLRLTEDDIQMVVLPFFYVMGKSLLNTHFATGATVVINNKFAFPAAVLKDMEEERVTGFSGVPSTYAYLLHRSPLAKYRGKLKSLRYCSQAGGHMSRQIKEELRRILPDHTQIFIMYGATEASARLTYLEPARFWDKMDSIGKPIPGVTLKILDDKGRAVPVGQTGELVASGDNIMMGYWRDAESTAGTLDQNGYHTGDVAFQDDEGFYYVSGRRDSLLKVGGHRINPQEIEDVLMSTDLILEAVVHGIPDPLLGHRMAALAAPKNNGCGEAQVLALCAKKLPKYKVPGSLKLVRTLPKNSSGKIDRDKCIQMLASAEPGS